MDASTIKALIREGVSVSSGDARKADAICEQLQITKTGQKLIWQLVGATIEDNAKVKDRTVLFKFQPHKGRDGLIVHLFGDIYLNNKGRFCRKTIAPVTSHDSDLLNEWLGTLSKQLIKSISLICDPILEEGKYE